MAKNWMFKNEENALVRTYSEKGIDEKTGKVIYTEVGESLYMALTEIFPLFQSYSDVQKQMILNGLRQKMDDSIARSKDMTLSEKEKREVQSSLWDRISVDGIWNEKKKGERKERGASVSLSLVVPEFLKLGMSARKIAELLGKKQEIIEKFMRDGVDAEEEEDDD